MTDCTERHRAEPDNGLAPLACEGSTEETLT